MSARVHASDCANLRGTGDCECDRRSTARVKQVIVIRRDYPGGIKLRRGKEIAQGAHASMAWLTNRLKTSPRRGNTGEHSLNIYSVRLTAAEMYWVEGNFRKIVCQVPDEAALIAIAKEAGAAGLATHFMEDEGLTEFKGVKTATAVGIGPDFDDKIDAVCGKLELY